MSEISIAHDDRSSNFKPGSYVIVIASSHHSFAGTLLWRQGDDIMLGNARSLPYWMSHLMLADVAAKGIDDVKRFRLPRVVDQILVIGAKAIIATTEKCRDDLTSAANMVFDRPMIYQKATAAIESDVNPYQDTFGT